MKNFFKYSFIALSALAVVGMSSCKNDDDKVEPVVVTQENNIPNVSVDNIFTVHVKSSTVTPGGKAAGLSGATVTVTGKGFNQTAVTGEDGIATFAGLPEGYVYFFVKGPDATYIKYNSDDYYLYYEGEFDTDGEDALEGEGVYTYSNYEEVTLSKMNASMEGYISGDFDQDGDFGDGAADFKAGVQVNFVISNEYEPNVFTATTDASGKFTMTGLPEEINGTVRVYDFSEAIIATGNYGPGNTNQMLFFDLNNCCWVLDGAKTTYTGILQLNSQVR